MHNGSTAEPHQPVSTEILMPLPSYTSAVRVLSLYVICSKTSTNEASCGTLAKTGLANVRAAWHRGAMSGQSRTLPAWQAASQTGRRRRQLSDRVRCRAKRVETGHLGAASGLRSPGAVVDGPCCHAGDVGSRGERGEPLIPKGPLVVLQCSSYSMK